MTSLSSAIKKKRRLLYRFRSDHNEDRTDEILSAWRNSTAAADYHRIDLLQSDNATSELRRANEEGPFDWPESRHQAIIDMKQEALEHAKRSWADYVFVSYAI